MAFENYRVTAMKYFQGLVNQDCLGIARQFYCAANYKYCDPDTGEDELGVCAWLCEKFLQRCPKLKEDYAKYCSNPRTTKCLFET